MHQKRTQPVRQINNQILTWVRGKDAGGKPPSREFLVKEVLESYVPPDIRGLAQYFTAIETGKSALSRLRLRLSPEHKLRVIDPCAGIGHWPYLFSFMRDQLIFDAFEIEDECVEVGRGILPWINWFNRSSYTAMAEVEGRYDLGICNPPIGITRGGAIGKQVSQSRCSRSEHIFLELSIRALKAGGQLVILGPPLFLDNRPKALRRWMEERVILTDSFGPLPMPSSVSIPLHAFYFTRKGAQPAGAEEIPAVPLRLEESDPAVSSQTTEAATEAAQNSTSIREGETL